jgi:signal transduction histidine kinase
MVIASAEFRELIGNARQGSAARFVNNRLNLLFWYRPETASHLVYGGSVNLQRVAQDLARVIRETTVDSAPEVCFALLDDTTRAVATSVDDFNADWDRPFVAAEIGEALPHWEIGVYRLDPDRLRELARTTSLILGALVLALVAAIAVGGWLVVRDLRQELLQAQRKTHFVSNVSHELKTPLTSIRMFAELLAEGRVTAAEKQKQYLGIITAEAARLTRLINNVLDFARLERGEKRYEFEELDLCEVIRETLSILRPHWEQSGVGLELELSTEPLLVRGDRDALAQVLMNLLANAEKYSVETPEIRVETRQHLTPLPFAEVRVLDRGPGVPAGSEQKVFEHFYRAHDALNSGVQGSGLGLTLARQIARAHSGDVIYSAREGGGACFTLRLPSIPVRP